MKFSSFLNVVLPVLLGTTLVGCKTTEEKEQDQIVAPTGTLTDQSQDTSFRAFISRLKKAAAKRDVKMLSSMMAPNFGYSWEPGGEGIGVFEYWTRHNLWAEVSAVLNEPFVLNGDYMVAPPAVRSTPDYPGYRAGVRLVNGSWRFAYFVPPPPQ